MLGSLTLFVAFLVFPFRNCFNGGDSGQGVRCESFDPRVRHLAEASRACRDQMHTWNPLRRWERQTGGWFGMLWVDGLKTHQAVTLFPLQKSR